VCISRFFGLKNQLVLLDAMKLWRTENRATRLELELAGDRGPTRHGLEREVRRRGLGSAVAITTVRSSADVAGALGRAHALVHSSRCESLSQAVLEAMAVGLPVLTGPNVGAREEIERRGGRISPAFDVESAASLKAALADLIGGYSNHRDDTLDLRALIHREFTDREFAAALDAAVEGKPRQ
jgi:glycosyltransferase involved in cell wall biosynthesis